MRWMVYFDAHSSVGHPTVDKWIPLEYKGGPENPTQYMSVQRDQKVSCYIVTIQQLQR
jgi:hypothetical protein